MIRGLGDFKKEEDKNQKKTSSYVGGEKSGLAVENYDNNLEELIEKAKKGGREHQAAGAGQTELKITLYSNGFVVGDGPFRPYEAEENKKFMEELNTGYIPSEIRNKYKNGLSVGLEDKR